MNLPADLARLLEFASVGFAILYLALAIRQSLWCWPAALVSTLIWMVVAADARLYMDSALQVFYFAMGIYGWLRWRGGAGRVGARVHWWRPSIHAAVLVLTLLLSAIAARALSGTDAEFPFLDSFTTVAAVIATFMVAHKVMENWIYWFVIDSAYIYLYVERGLFGYAGLYIVYLVMIVIGFQVWRQEAASRGMEADAQARA